MVTVTFIIIYALLLLFSLMIISVDAGALFVEANQQITVALAPSKEDLSLRAYTARRKLNRLRRCACMLFQSEPVVRVIQKVEYEVERGGLKIRTDRKIHADYGRCKI